MDDVNVDEPVEAATEIEEEPEAVAEAPKKRAPRAKKPATKRPARKKAAD